MTFDDLTTDLRQADCPLLKDDPDLGKLLAEYNQAAATLRQIRERRPAALELEEMQPALEALAQQRTSLTRRRYLMGFLGTSQAGKSTTFNHVLNLTEQDDPPACSGSGLATTSAITRLFAKPPGDKPEISLVYLTEGEYRKRRETLCTRANLQNLKDRTDEELIELLAKPQAGSHDKSGFTVLPNDRPFLREFVRSHREFGTRLVRQGTPFVDTSVEYTRRKEFVNHKDTDKERGEPPPNPNLMIAEAVVGYPTEQIAPELEMVDCPGLGSARTVDTVLTKDYINRLDGALLFIKAEQPDSGDVNEILVALKERFPHGLAGRVWVVVNKFDVPTRAAKLIGDQKQRTTFDQIVGIMAEKGIPLTQVCLACSNIFRQAHDNGGSIDRAEALRRLDLKPDDEQSDALQRIRQTAPDLWAAFQHLLDDGGIAHLRRLIKETVARSVAAKIRADVYTELLALNGKLRHLLERFSNPVDDEQLAAAETCRNRLVILLHRLSGRNRYFDPLAGDMRTSLEKLMFSSAEHEDLIRNRWGPAELENEFKLLTRKLDRTLDSKLNAAVQSVYDQMREDLTDLPTVRLTDFEQGVKQALIQFQSDDLSRRDWRAGLPKFDAPGLVQGLQLTGPEYVETVREKIRSAVYQALHLLRERVKGRVRDLANQAQTIVFQGHETRG